jgi:hypothetical protein
MHKGRVELFRVRHEACPFRKRVAQADFMKMPDAKASLAIQAGAVCTVTNMSLETAAGYRLWASIMPIARVDAGAPTATAPA